MSKHVTILLASTALGLAFFAGGMDRASAADWNPPVQGYSWTGPYVGVHAGSLWGDMHSSTFATGPIPGGFDPDPDGFAGGVLGGYNYQIDHLVLGVEGDVSFGDVDGQDSSFPGLPIEAEIDTTYSIRGRIGYAIDRTLLFATGGVSWAEAEVAWTPGGVTFDDKNTHFGWQIGGGIEYALTDNIAVRGEYLYSDYGSENYDVVGAGGAASDSYDLSTHTLRAAVIWNFGNLFGY